MLSARSLALIHRPYLSNKLRLGLGLASLVLLQLFPATDSVAQALHGKLRSAAVKLMLEASEPAILHSPAVDELRALLPRLDSQLQPPPSTPSTPWPIFPSASTSPWCSTSRGRKSAG